MFSYLQILYFPETQTIARRAPRRPERENTNRVRINDRIRISPVRLIRTNSEGKEEQLGVVDLDKAKHMARDAQLDLVEISPNTRPPVCKIMDYGRFKYLQKKKEQKAKAHSKRTETKGVRLRPKIGPHDLELKMKMARKFMLAGNKVQFVMQFRGREMAHRDLGRKTLMEIIASFEDIARLEAAPSMMGRRMSMLLSPDKAKVAEVIKHLEEERRKREAAGIKIAEEDDLLNTENLEDDDVDTDEDDDDTDDSDDRPMSAKDKKEAQRAAKKAKSKNDVIDDFDPLQI